jgi:short-subunit dehydrogenase
MQPLPYESVYAASKAFALHFSEALHAELRGSGVRALAVNPGPVPTEWQQVAGYDEGTNTMPGKIGPDQVVRESLDAYDKGRRSLIPGRTFRWIMRGSKLGTRGTSLRIAERIYRPRS